VIALDLAVVSDLEPRAQPRAARRLAALPSPSPAAPGAAGAPALVILSDSVDAHNVDAWCRYASPALRSLCMHGWSKERIFHAANGADDCAEFDRAALELERSLVHTFNFGLLACYPNADARLDAVNGVATNSSVDLSNHFDATVLVIYNVYGALNLRQATVVPAPPAEMSLHDVLASLFELVPRLLRAEPTAVMVHSLFWDLSNTFAASGERFEAIRAEGAASVAWVAEYAAAVRGELDAVDALTRGWPGVSLRVWRSANRVNNDGGHWRTGANGLIERANAAAIAVARARNHTIFDFEHFPGSDELRDNIHPVHSVGVTAIEAVLAAARRAAAGELRLSDIAAAPR
jgi:hypothetical protein